MQKGIPAHRGVPASLPRGCDAPFPVGQHLYCVTPLRSQRPEGKGLHPVLCDGLTARHCGLTQ